MDAKRWSPLWVFAGGCLTGAALIAAHLGKSTDRSEASSSTRRANDWAELVELSARASLVDSVSRAQRDDQGGAEPSSAPTALAQPATPASSETGAGAQEKAEGTEGGNSVGDVLAQLEADYRKQSAPGATTQPALPALPTSPASPTLPASPAQNEPAKSEQQAAAPAPEALASDARSTPASNDDAKPTPPAADEATRVASVGEAKPEGSDSAQQKVAAQMQQVAALQQATLVEQHALLQYLQLLSLSPAARSAVPEARTAAPARSRSRARGARITAALPSSISDTDNPWGFDLKPAVLAR